MMSLSPSDCRVMLGTIVQGSKAKYYIQDIIGEGGQGWVFRASYDDAEGFPVVVKVLRPDSASTRDALDRFRREAEILQRLSSNNPSPFIVRFYDHGEADFALPLAMSPAHRAQLPFTVMEYVHGEPLHAVLDKQRGTGLQLRRVRRILREIHKALEIVHAQGLIHRDLKPSNILLSQEAGREVAKVTDFGLVKVVDLRATSTQSLAGVSLSYAPPEQYEAGNARVGPWTDVFSYAAVVYELLCGREAYPANRSNPFEALRLIASSRRERLIEKLGSVSAGLRERPDLVKQLESILDGALDPEPSRRPQTIGGLWEPVDAVLREAEARADDPSGPRAPAPIAQFPSAPPPVYPAPQPTFMRVPDLPISPLRQGSAPELRAPSGGELPVVGGRKDPSDLRAWTFRCVSPGTAGAQVRDAAFGDDARDVLTLGNAGLVQWAANGWTSYPLALGMTHGELRGVARIGAGAWVLGGDQGVVAYVQPGGTWDVRRFDPDVLFHAVAVDPTLQRVLAVGQRVSRGHGIVVEALASGFRRTFELTDLGPLRAVTWLDERHAFACGDAGALVRIDDAGLQRVAWERSGHLRAIVARSGASPMIFAVGTGGHALALPPHAGARPDIEKVTTTQDLLGVCVTPDGAAWACSANARVLRRDTSNTWRRVMTELPFQGNLLRIAGSATKVLIVAEDASILEASV